MSILSSINNKFGTHRGFVRYLISQIKYLAGHYKQQENVDWSKVHRLVFICQGNICRSPFADVLARKYTNKSISFGYATTTGVNANETAQIVAKSKFGIDLSTHKATDMKDFVFQDGDLLIVMEDRHLEKITIPSTTKSIQMTLLGIWANQPKALIYDPFSHSKEYFESCFYVIKSAVENIIEKSEFK